MELREIGPDIFMLKVTVPIDVDKVNLYIFRGDHSTLIDAGTNTPQVYNEIKEALDYLGIKRLDQTIATHWHVDHAGATGLLAQEGTAVRMGEKDYQEWMNFLNGEYSNLYRETMAQEWGVPIDDVPSMLTFYKRLTKLVTVPEKVETIKDQEIIQAGNTQLQAILTPGHTAGHLSFYDVKNNLLFTGDVLLPGQIPYPSIWREEGKIVSGMMSYLESLDTIEKLNPQEYYSSHGEKHGSAVERCQEIRSQIQKQVNRYQAQPSIYESALAMSRGKIDPVVIFYQMHYIYGWEQLKS